MNWVFQKTGIINRYNQRFHEGTQPIRVLNPMIQFIFENTHPSFRQELTNAIYNYGFSKNIYIISGEKPIYKTPHIRNVDKSIILDETFLSYLWCISHSIYTLYIQTVEIPRLNQQTGFIKYQCSQDKIDKAIELFDYAKFLIKAFEKWDINNLPNPERYLAENRVFIEQPNIFYTEALKFILLHEYIHAIKHIEKIKDWKSDYSHYIQYEKEADHESIELMKQGIFPNKMNELPVHIGTTIGILSMFFFRPTTSAKKHPNTEDRLVSALQQLELAEHSECWGIALIGLELWSEQFGLNLNWDKRLSDKDAFEEIVKQIRKK